MIADRPFYAAVLPDHPATPVELSVTHLVPGADYRLEVYRTGYEANDAYTAYLRMGAPKNLTGPQIAYLDYLTQDQPERDQIERAGQDGRIEISVPMRSNDVVLVTVRRSYKTRPNHELIQTQTGPGGQGTTAQTINHVPLNSRNRM